MKVQIGVLSGILLLLAMMILEACSSAQAGPNGGDVVPLTNSQATAEVVANADTGEVMVHTWDQNLKNSRPIESKPMMIGSGDQTVELQPYPTTTDPPVPAAGSTVRRIGYAEAGCARAGSAAARTRTGASSPGTIAGGAAQPTVQCGLKWASVGAE